MECDVCDQVIGWHIFHADPQCKSFTCNASIVIAMPTTDPYKPTSNSEQEVCPIPSEMACFGICVHWTFSVTVVWFLSLVRSFWSSSQPCWALLAVIIHGFLLAANAGALLSFFLHFCLLKQCSEGHFCLLQVWPHCPSPTSVSFSSPSRTVAI